MVPDPGLQAERTELAWRRTQLSLLVIACLALRGQSPLLAVLALATAAVPWLGQRRRYQRSLAMLREERGHARPGMVLATGLASLALALVALADLASNGRSAHFDTATRRTTMIAQSSPCLTRQLREGLPWR
ncbi:DUF202 domain-containing protein [Metapseudomonas lalkuanensis]|uniref:DUF202 domain-containing protein n=1 Tax=Metapseudomonas lalkuanensis TaxID=2604832 RepID=A0A5J6QJJ0_9GAMM|nr:DUF202 domain-containing protein [Pseudomonas lalkuanensis]QEY62898.1 DUF202 domain-containing protein [Pseudomonas lalkuanensis]